jgi:RimJ/RimL family protein N-acetyltransferase
MYLMMKNAFDLGYRRYEWKCDNLNLYSKKAARRLGFSFDGLFKQAAVYKGRNRDTAWFSILDTHWPAIQAEYERWLAADNFTVDGIQLSKLST